MEMKKMGSTDSGTCYSYQQAAAGAVKLSSGSCPASRQFTKEECLAAAKSVGASASKNALDGGNDAGVNGRPQGCTLHEWGNVEWWGPSNNANCGSLNYNCVCQAPAAATKLSTGSCPASKQFSKEECLEAAKSVGASASKTALDGGDDAGLNGRPQGCTLHEWGNVEWWGPSNNAKCGSLNYNCVCQA